MNIFGIDVRFKWLWPRDPNEAIVPFQFNGVKRLKAKLLSLFV